MPGQLVPFGKYKGQPLEVLAHDQDYCDWLMAQPWFVERYTQIHTLIVNQFGEPTETPEHNALQIRCLEERFRLQVTRLALAFFHPMSWEVDCTNLSRHRAHAEITPYLAALGPVVFEQAGVDAQWWVRPWQVEHTTTSSQWPTALQQRWTEARAALIEAVNTFVSSEALRQALAQKHLALRALLDATMAEVKATRHYITSEQERWWGEDREFLDREDCLDILVRSLHCTSLYVSDGTGIQCQCSYGYHGNTVSHQLFAYGRERCQAFAAAHGAEFLHLDAHHEYFDMAVTLHTHTWHPAETTDPISVECKPWMGDDYPAVLRQVTKLPGTPGHVVVLAGAVHSQTVPLEAIRQFFAHSGVCLLLVDEVEQAEPLPLDTLDTLPPAHDAYHAYALQECEECATMSTIECVPF